MCDELCGGMNTYDFCDTCDGFVFMEPKNPVSCGA